MTTTVREKLSKAEELLQSGFSQKAQNQLMDIRLGEASRQDCLKWATLLRRTGAYEMALKVLYPVVRSNNPNITPEAKEIAIYRGLLNSIGGSEEAIRLITQSRAHEKETSALLVLAFAFFSQWNYEAAIPILESYLERVDRDSYDHAIGQVNYVAALVATEQFEQAIPLLHELKKYFSQNRMKILLGNCNEILGQVHFKEKNYEKAIPCLEDAKKQLGGKEPDTLFVKKWKLFISLSKNQSRVSTLQQITILREKARSLVLWETPRDIDLHIALITQNSDLFNHVYYGSPFNGYRKKMLINGHDKLESRYFRQLGTTSPKMTLEVNQLTERIGLRIGSLEERLLTVLVQDFYRPHRGATIFNQVYLGENFHPEHSQNKVKLLVSRLRKRLEPFGLGVDNILGKSYQLAEKSQVTLIYDLCNQKGIGLAEDLRLKKLEEAFRENWFTTERLSQELGVSQRTASRWLNQWVETNRIAQEGRRKSARYRLLRSA